ncbi:MAG: cytochrome c3 family protein [Thermodesulfobacteriota bacterium]|nr:cytochrome c3 family protein [Thermodesulfobacteriota bacterium]
MSKKIVVLMLIAGVTILFSSTGIFAGTEVADTFKMETKEYAKHKKNLVEFTHKKHAEEYTESCGECHHDADGKPLSNLKMGDDVQRCVECHKETKKKKGEKISKKEKIKKYQKYAMHENCKGCHKAFNKEKGYTKKDKDAAPTGCSDCHPR